MRFADPREAARWRYHDEVAEARKALSQDVIEGMDAWVEEVAHLLARGDVMEDTAVWMLRAKAHWVAKHRMPAIKPPVTEPPKPLTVAGLLAAGMRSAMLLRASRLEIEADRAWLADQREAMRAGAQVLVRSAVGRVPYTELLELARTAHHDMLGWDELFPRGEPERLVAREVNAWVAANRREPRRPTPEEVIRPHIGKLRGMQLVALVEEDCRLPKAEAIEAVREALRRVAI